MLFRMQIEGDWKMNSRINKIARKIVIDAGNNVFDDYFDFYSDGKWVIKICRTLIKTLGMINAIQSYNKKIQKINEYVNYLKDVDLQDMNTKQSYSKVNFYVKKIKKSYNKYIMQEEPQERDKFLGNYKKQVSDLIQFIVGYEESCVSIYNRRYVEDHENVSNLLETVEQGGIEVLNKKETVKKDEEI